MGTNRPCDHAEENNYVGGTALTFEYDKRILWLVGRVINVVYFIDCKKNVNNHRGPLDVLPPSISTIVFHHTLSYIIQSPTPSPVVLPSIPTPMVQPPAPSEKEAILEDWLQHLNIMIREFL